MAGATTTKTTAVTKSLGASLAITSVDELMKLAQVLYLGGAQQLPGCGRPEAVAHVILAGAEVGLSPTAALSTIMLVGGKTTVYGDGALALVYASGLMDEFKEWTEGSGDDLTYHCKVKRKGEQEPIVRTWSVADAKKADLWEGGSKKKDNWIKFGKRMMTMRPRGFALRDKFPDVLKGLHIWEEIVDTVPEATWEKKTEVKVIEVTVDAPALQQLSATATQPAVTPATPADTSGPVTDAQANEFRRLRSLVMASKGLHDPAEQKAAWTETLSAYGVTSVAQLTRARAEVVIADLIKKQDPFTAGPSDPPTSTA